MPFSPKNYNGRQAKRVTGKGIYYRREIKVARDYEIRYNHS